MYIAFILESELSERFYSLKIRCGIFGHYIFPKGMGVSTYVKKIWVCMDIYFGV